MMSTIKPLGLKDIKALGLNNIEISNNKGEVYLIKLSSKLYDGSANEINITKLKKGLLYGMTCNFEVVSYIGEKPQTNSEINWEMSYYDIEEGKQEILPISSTGESISLDMRNNDTCGSYLYIRAYIKDKKNNAVLKIWKHNYFRWFSGVKIRNEVEARKINPWKINQDDTNTCGPSAIMYVFAKNNPSQYGKFILDLHRKGLAKHNNYIIDVNSDNDLRNIANTNPNSNKNFPKNMAYADWIPNACITDQENGIFDFEGNNKEDFSGITLPSRLVRLAQNLIGFTDVKDETSLYFNKNINETLEAIEELIKAKNDGYEVFLLISINMLNNQVTNSIKSTAEHWIVLENINQSIDPNFVEFNVYTWGKDPTEKKYKISYEVFRTNYYGYVKAK